MTDLSGVFSDLHTDGHFMIPNAWDVGSARILEAKGFEAIATTSSGFAASLGIQDQKVTFDQLVAHVKSLCDALEIPVSVDAEYGYSEAADGLAETVDRLAGAGAAGMSIEDFIPGRGLLGFDEAVERVGRVVQAAKGSGMTITARAENHLYGNDDFDDTIGRLEAYRDAGADVLYAPFVREISRFELLVARVKGPVNALLLPGGPSVSALAAVGVRRMSTGGALAFAAYGALERAADELLSAGTSLYTGDSLSRDLSLRAFGDEG